MWPFKKKEFKDFDKLWGKFPKLSYEAQIDLETDTGEIIRITRSELGRDRCRREWNIKIKGKWEFFNSQGIPTGSFPDIIVGYKVIKKGKLDEIWCRIWGID